MYESLYGAYIETIETVEEFKQKYPNGKVFRKENFDLTEEPTGKRLMILTKSLIALNLKIKYLKI